MLPILDATQARIIGALMEKSVVTPDQYPLTLNALTNACNQKSSRNPVMALSQGEVQRAARELKQESLLEIEENFRNGSEKYKQRLCNTPFNDYKFDAAQFACVCVLLLRGPQTPGELKANTPRLHSFADNTEVVSTLTSLAHWHSGALVVQLPRTSGRKDSEYMHLFSGEIDIEALAAEAQNRTASKAGNRSSNSGLEQRLSNLEAEVATLKAQLQTLL